MSRNTQSFDLSQLFPDLSKLPFFKKEIKLLINIPMKMLRVSEDGKTTAEYPIAIGAPQYKTPTGSFQISRIEWNPWWYPPDSEWAKGEEKTPPGPKNPLGPVKMVLKEDLRIHGTNKPKSIGQAASHGCIRMLNEDAKKLAWLIQNQHSSKDEEALLEKYTKNRKSTFVVPLDRPVPVDFIYDPIVVKKDTLEIYPDIYWRLKTLKESILKKLEEAKMDTSKFDEQKIASLKKPTKEKLTIPFKELEREAHASQDLR